MRKSYANSRLCAFLALSFLEFQAMVFYEKTHAFSSCPPSSAVCTRNLKLIRLAVVNDDANQVDENPTTDEFPIRYDPSRRRFRCRVAYDGTSFAGFQLQGGRGGPKAKTTDDPSMTKEKKKQQRQNEKYNNNPRTIQGEIEKVLSRRFQRLVRVVGAGRTDGGVHARGQAIHFDLYHNETEPSSSAGTPYTADNFSFERDLETTMNRMLPSDIRVWNVGTPNRNLVTDTGSEHTPHGWYNWNAMRSGTSKLYSYRICVGDSMNPAARHHRWQLPWEALDIDRLERILQLFEGEHDFVCFAGALEQQEKKTGVSIGTVRTIHKINLVQEKRMDSGMGSMGGETSGNYYRIDIYLDGALYKMVRNIVGTAIDVTRGWLEEETLEDLLTRPAELNYTRKNNPCKPAPSNGLTLERVFYPDDF